MSKPKDYNKIALTHIRSSMRKTWMFYSVNRKEALNKSKVSRGKYRCNHCNETYGPKQVQVDHVRGIGKLTFDNLGSWVMNLMFGEQVVMCKPCHLYKTNEERKCLRNSTVRQKNLDLNK